MSAMEDRMRIAMAQAWDEGWSRCSDWWHECAVGDSHAERNANPYRALTAEGTGNRASGSMEP